MSGWEEFPNLYSALEEGRQAGLHRGVQIYISRNGETLLDEACGQQDDSHPLTSDHLMLWLSAGKPLTAVALGVLHDRGLLDWEDPLSRYFPAWAMFGQPEVTLRQLLTHTAGFENRNLGWPQKNWEEIIAEIVEHPLPDDWSIGEEAGYVVAASWFLLGDVIAKVTQRTFSEALRELVLDPLGMPETFCGLPESQYPDVKPRLGKMYERSPQGLIDLKWNDRQRVTSAAPGGNTRGPIRELGRFYESLLPEATTSILRPSTRELLTSRQRSGLSDRTFRHRIDWGLGFIVNSNRYGADTVPYGFGSAAGEASFGHGGSQSSLGFADPEHRLVVAWAANGRPGEPRHQSRNRQINAAISRDLGMTSE